VIKPETRDENGVDVICWSLNRGWREFAKGVVEVAK